MITWLRIINCLLAGSSIVMASLNWHYGNSESALWCLGLAIVNLQCTTLFKPEPSRY